MLATLPAPIVELDTPLATTRRFLRWLAEERNCSPATHDAYRVDLDQLTDWLVGPNLASTPDWPAVTTEHLHAYREQLERRYAAATVARKVASLKSFFHWLAAEGLIRQDPTRDLPAISAVAAAPVRVLTADHLARLLAQPRRVRETRDARRGTFTRGDRPEDLRDDALLRLLATTGVTGSEAVGLDDLDLNLATDCVRVVKRGRERFIPFDPPTHDALVRYRYEARPRLTDWSQSVAFFVNHRGERLTRQGLWLIVGQHAEAAGLGWLNPHVLRHAYALRLMRDATDRYDVQALLGYASVATTERYRCLVGEQGA